MAQYVHAAKEISPGEELYVSCEWLMGFESGADGHVDLNTELPHEERQAASMLSWGFRCTCSLCRQPESHLYASDLRLSMIKSLKERLNDWSEDLPDRSAMALTLVELYHLERLYVPIVSAYEAAAYAFSVAGDRWRAIEWASKAVEAMTIFYGGEHTLARDLEGLMMAPELHRTWLFSATKPNKTTQ
jgi:hypothetical protein